MNFLHIPLEVQDEDGFVRRIDHENIILIDAMPPAVARLADMPCGR